LQLFHAFSRQREDSAKLGIKNVFASVIWSRRSRS